MTKRKVNFYLSDEALRIIEKRSASANKRGDWLSQAIIAYDAILNEDETLAALATIASRLERLIRPARD